MAVPAYTVSVEAIPFVDLSASHAHLKSQILDDISVLIDSGAFVNGQDVAEFETAFAAFCGTRCCVGVSSGLDALRLAFLAAGLQPGDEVVLPAYTFAATVEAVIQAGGSPVLADVSARDYNLDPAAVEAAVTPRTRFLLPVHLYGQMADMAALEEIARRHDLLIVEDACQAHGARRDGRRAGSGGLAGTFSFYPAKNLGAMGDAGACATDDGALAERMRALREHGQRRKYEHELEGYTARMDSIQALVLRRKLPLLDEWNEERRAAAQLYTELLDGIEGMGLPPVPERSDPVWHLFVIRIADPELLANFLRERGIETGRHYPQPLHLAPAYLHLGYRAGAFPVSEALAGEVLSLPMYPGIAEAQIAAVADAVKAYFHG